MKNNYNSEIEGMVDFYKELGIQEFVDYDCNTDGSIKGCLNEFKLNFTDLLSHKNQVSRYIKAYNSTAKKIPTKALLIDINNRKFIEGDITTFNGGVDIKWGLEKIWNTPHELVHFYKIDKYCKGWIDEESIISYNNLFCSINNKKTTSKEEVRSEFINPKILNIFNFDWHKQIDLEKNKLIENHWLTFNMNMLGSDILKKQLGAFFTPDSYIKISTEYLRNAIKNVPEGQDYVIIDRCAGTGNLEKFLTEKELSHCILNTIDYTEWTTLKGIYEGRVRYIIPHNSNTRDDITGLMEEGDALQKEFYDKILNLLKEKYIIMLENPPYADVGGASGGHNKDRKKSFINKEMIEKVGGNKCNELGHQFIWSAWDIIKPNEYILYSPIKYWKLHDLSNKKFINGCLCKSEKFNTPNKFAISLIHWKNEEENKNEIFLNIENSNEKILIKKCKKIFTHDKKKYDTEVIAKYRADTFMMGSLNEHLSNYDNGTAIMKRSKPIYKENILDIIPLWCAKQKYNYYQSWTEKVVIFNSFDGKEKYLKDEEFKRKCLLYACLIDYNKCISNNDIKNELCLLQNTISDSILNANEKNHYLLKLWKEILEEASSKEEYISDFKYGLYQIQKDINKKIESGSFNKKGEPILVLKYSTLDEKIKKIKEELKKFYLTEIQPKLFEYELLK